MMVNKVVEDAGGATSMPVSDVCIQSVIKCYKFHY